MFTQTTAFVLLAVLPGAVLAQVTAWGQCGGTGYSGPTTCVSGYTCTVSNEWYSQCLPSGSAPAPTTSAPAATTSNAPQPTSTGGPNYWFSFGDSYTTTGFNPSGTQPSPGNVFGNPAYPGQTDGGGGEGWLDVAVTKYNPTTILAYNYAFGGATIDANLVKPYSTSVKTMTDQVNQFLSWNSGAGKGKWNSANALFSVYIGINDIGGSYSQSGDRGAFSDKLIAAQFNLLSKLYDVGARNFLVLNVPPVQRSPQVVSWGSAAVTAEGNVIKTHNTKLAAATSNFKASHSGATTYFFDNYAAFNTILDNYQQYGFSSVTAYGQANNFWGNNYHPSSKAQALFGKQVSDLLAGTVW